MITVRSTINLAHQSVPNIIPVVQGDTGRAILFTLADFTIPEGAVARYFVMKPSGLSVYNDATIDGNTVLVELTAQSIIETGDNYGQVRISVGDDIVTSFDFILHVDPFRGIDAVESDAEVNIFDRALEQAQETVDTMVENAEQAIEDAAEAAKEYIAQAIDPTLTIEGKAADAKAVGDALTEINDKLNDPVTGLDTRAPAIYCTTSGSLVTIPDGADSMPVKSLTVAVEAVQSGSGDPSPTNIRPISGWTGCKLTRTGFNLWDEEWEVGTISAQTGETTPDPNRIRSKNYIPCVPSTDYCFTKLNVSATTDLRPFFYDADKSFIRVGSWSSGKPVQTTPSSCHYMKFICATSYGKTYNHDICVNLSDPAKNGTYETYTGNVYDITFPDSAGTVYGGTVDPVAGTMKVTKANIASYEGETLPGAWISDRDVYAEGTTPTTGAQVVYDLATPLTFTLDPVTIRTLLGLNNIWADTGSIEEVTYAADTKMYIEQLTEPDADMIADTNITSGSYFMVGNQLFLATANIANGADIVVGTNCTRTNLAEALNALNA